MSTTDTIFWVDDLRRIDPIPGQFRRWGRYLYLLDDGSSDVRADGHLVDGVQLVRTDERRPTVIERDGVRLLGVQRDGRIGVQLIAADARLCG